MMAVIQPASQRSYLCKNKPMEAGMKFEMGEKVMLKSGGPEMIIRGLHYDVLANRYSSDMYDCIWFDLNSEGKREVHYCPFHWFELEPKK